MSRIDRQRWCGGARPLPPLVGLGNRRALTEERKEPTDAPVEAMEAVEAMAALLTLGESDEARDVTIDMKRGRGGGGGGGGGSRGGGGGGGGTLRHDAGGAAVRLILLSRLIQSRDEAALDAIANRTDGRHLLALLRAAFLDAAKGLAGAAAAELSPANVETLFGAAGSSLSYPQLYSALLNVPNRLPYAIAAAVYRAMLDAMRRDDAAAVAALLLGPPPDPSNAVAASVANATIAVYAGRVQARVFAKLGLPAVAHAFATEEPALNSDSQNAALEEPAVPPTTPPLEEEELWPALPMPPAVPPPPSVLPPLEPTASLAENCTRLIVTSLAAPPSDGQRDAIREALVQSIDLLVPAAQSGEALLAMPLLEALLRPAGAQLLAQVLEALSPPPDGQEMRVLLERVVAGCAAVAGQLATASLCDFLDEDALASLGSGSGINARPPQPKRSA